MQKKTTTGDVIQDNSQWQKDMGTWKWKGGILIIETGISLYLCGDFPVTFEKDTPRTNDI